MQSGHFLFTIFLKKTTSSILKFTVSHSTMFLDNAEKILRANELYSHGRFEGPPALEQGL